MQCIDKEQLETGSGSAGILTLDLLSRECEHIFRSSEVFCSKHNSAAKTKRASRLFYCVGSVIFDYTGRRFRIWLKEEKSNGSVSPKALDSLKKKTAEMSSCTSAKLRAKATRPSLKARK